jgi:hypothetical protein
MNRARVKPSKASSVLGMIMGVIFIGIGLVVGVPNAGGFGAVWLLVAVAITLFHTFNVFSDRGIATSVVDIETQTFPISPPEPPPPA